MKRRKRSKSAWSKTAWWKSDLGQRAAFEACRKEMAALGIVVTR